MSKKIAFPAIVLFVLILIVAAVLFSGILITPTHASLASLTPVESHDILMEQYQRERAILEDYNMAGSNAYTSQEPYIIQDPYQANPLSALILFESAEPLQVSVSVAGKDEYTTFQFTYGTFRTHHEVAVLGLYAGQENRVQLVLTNQAGQQQEMEYVLQTEPLPYDFPNLTIEVSQPEKMEPGVNLMIPCFDSGYTYLLDTNGDVRAYFTNRNFGHGTAMRLLENGHLLATGDVMKMMPYNMYTLWEWNLLGKVFVEYEIPNAVHHDVIELANGDFLAVSNHADMPLEYDTREDVVVRIDRQTGQVIDEYDLRQILDPNRDPYNHFDPGVQNTLNTDWAHLNSAVLDESSNSLIVSSPIQSSLVKFDADTMNIDWILSSPEGWDGEFNRFEQYLLQPVGKDFEWQWGQHAAMIMPDRDQNPDTMDVLLFDNGQARSYDEPTSVAPENNYSRAVIYRINEVNRTVEQLWQYGKERGAEAYSTFLGDVNLLPSTGNIQTAFGGMLRKDGVPIDDIVMGVLGEQQIQSRVVEVRQDGEVVFDVLVTPHNNPSAETYQVTRLDLYNPSIDYSLGQIQGERLGEVQSAKPTSYRLPNFFIPRISLNLSHIYEKNGYLILQGNFLYQEKSYMLGKLLFVLKNGEHTYIYPSNPGLNGNFYARIRLSEMEPGDYALYVAGGVVEGMDASGKVQPGFNPTGYKIEIK